jgi:hypothetical protein
VNPCGGRASKALQLLRVLELLLHSALLGHIAGVDDNSPHGGVGKQIAGNCVDDAPGTVLLLKTHRGAHGRTRR